MSTLLEKLQGMEALDLIKEKTVKVKLLSKLQADFSGLDLTKGSERAKMDKMLNILLAEKENLLLIEKVLKDKDF
jgi:hypothetical protein